MAFSFKRSAREIQIVSIDPVAVFSIGTGLATVGSIVVLLVLNALHKISLISYMRYVPFELEGVCESLANPFTIALALGIIIGLGLGICFILIVLLYNVFASVMGGIKIEVID